MTVFSNSELSTLIGSIYDCVLDSSRWDHALAETASFLECEHAILSLNDLQHHRILINRTVGWEPCWLDERSKHVSEIHGVLSKWLSMQSSLDHPFVASREIPEHQLETSPYVRDCLMPLGIIDIAHFFLVSTRARFSELVVARQKHKGIFTVRAIEAGALLLPHLRRAVTISDVLDVHALQRNRLTGILGALRNAVLLTNDRGVILYANRSAENLLRSGNSICSTSGILVAKPPQANGELHKAIRLAAQDETNIGNAGISIRLRGLEQNSTFAHVLPLVGSVLRAGIQPDAVVAVFITVNAGLKCGSVSFAAAFRLTPAETKVAGCLLAGQTLAETACELGIAMTTARTHLNNIFVKTGVGRQSEFVRLAVQAVSPIEPSLSSYLPAEIQEL